MASQRNEIEQAELEATLLELRISGASSKEISRVTGIPETDVSSRLSKIADRWRARNQQVVDEAAMIHHAREEAVWLLCIQPYLEQMRKYMAENGVPMPFDKELVASAIKVMDRQAKRLGLDAKPKVVSDEWLKEQTDTEIAEIARRYKIDLSMMEMPV